MKKVLVWLTLMVWLLSGCGTSSLDVVDSDRLTFTYIQASQQESSSGGLEDTGNQHLGSEANSELLESESAAEPIASIVTAQPTSKTVAEGENVDFTVIAKGDSLRYQWEVSKDGGKTWSNTIANSGTRKTLHFTAKKKYDGFIYRCIISNAAGTVATTDVVKLNVLYKPAITAQPIENTVAPGKTAVFTVVAVGGELSYQWEVSKDGGMTWSNTSFSGGTESTLRFTAKKEYSGLIYRCAITNSVDTTISDVAKLTVLQNDASSPTTAAVPTSSPGLTQLPALDLSHVVEDAWSGECRYTYNDGHGGKSTATAEYHVPKINLEFANVQAINEEILENSSRARDESDAGYPLDGSYPAYLSVDYEWSIKGDVLSLLITYDNSTIDADYYYLYTISVKTGKDVLKEDIIRTAGISDSEYTRRVKETLGSEVWLRCGPHVDTLTMDEWERLNNDLQLTISAENIDNARPYFNSFGELCVLGLWYYEAERGRFESKENLESYTISPYFAESIPMPENTTVVSDKYIVNVAKAAYFRSTPSESEDNVICTIPLNTIVGFIEVTDSVFSRVKYNGRYGYVKSEFLGNNPENPTPVSDGENTTVVSYKYIVNVDKAAYFRSSPSENADNVINTLLLNTKVGFIEVTDNVFSRVEYNGQYGYVKTEFLGDYPENTTPVSENTTIESYKYIVNVARTAYFRSTPNEYEDNVICTIPLNTEVGFIEVADSVFSRVEYNGQYGYVKSEFLGDYPEDTATRPLPDDEY